MSLVSIGRLGRDLMRDKALRKSFQENPEQAQELVRAILHPLRHETLRGDDQYPLHQPTQLQFPEDQPGFDGFAQANFIGQ